MCQGRLASLGDAPRCLVQRVLINRCIDAEYWPAALLLEPCSLLLLLLRYAHSDC
jgi:hypothetical protein